MSAFLHPCTCTYMSDTTETSLVTGMEHMTQNGTESHCEAFTVRQAKGDWQDR